MPMPTSACGSCNEHVLYVHDGARWHRLIAPHGATLRRVLLPDKIIWGRHA